MRSRWMMKIRSRLMRRRNRKIVTGNETRPVNGEIWTLPVFQSLNLNNNLMITLNEMLQTSTQHHFQFYDVISVTCVPLLMTVCPCHCTFITKHRKCIKYYVTRKATSTASIKHNFEHWSMMVMPYTMQVPTMMVMPLDTAIHRASTNNDGDAIRYCHSPCK